MDFVKRAWGKVSGIGLGPYVKIGAAIGLVCFGWWLGSSINESSWVKKENDRLQAQIELNESLDTKLKEAETEILGQARKLAEYENDLVRISTERNEAIDRAKFVKEKIIKVPGECESVRIITVDTGAYFRMFNAAINAATWDMQDSITASTGYGPLW